MGRLTTNQRERAMGMLDAGMSVRRVAQHFNVHHSTISRLRRRHNVTGVVKDRPRPGRPRVLQAGDDRFVRLTVLRNRFQPASRIRALLRNTRNINVSTQTVRNRLHRLGLKARRPQIGIVLPPRNRQLRLRWARTHIRWTNRQWQNVIFSDESRFSLDFADRRKRVWRRKNERHARCCVAEHDRFGGGSVMVWGAISWNSKSNLVFIDGNLNAQRYCNEVLRPHVFPYVRRLGNNALFQQDNARCHVARVCTALLTANNINTLDWPARSPDLSPIEHLWDILGRRARANHDVTSIRAMKRALQIEWQAIPQVQIKTLIRSMRKRCTACIRAQGGHTQY